MRITTAYFAGVGTVAVAIAAGLGGGLLFSNIVAPHEPKYAAEPTKLEQRTGARSIPVKSAPSEPTPYLAATQPAAATPVVAAVPTLPEPQTSPSPTVAAPPVEAKAASIAAAAEQVTSPPQAPPTEPAAREPAASPREAVARARDADIKRAATEKRRAERHQQWADKRRYRQPREQQLEAVEQSVRNVTEPRQAFMDEPARLDMPRIRLFGEE